MVEQNRKYFPYLLLGAVLTACTLFWSVTLWQAAAGYDGGRLVYAPGFVVRADAVRAVRLVPLAGAVLRNPAVNPHTDRSISLAW